MHVVDTSQDDTLSVMSGFMILFMDLFPCICSLFLGDASNDFHQKVDPCTRMSCQG